MTGIEFGGYRIFLAKIVIEYAKKPVLRAEIARIRGMREIN